MEIFEDFDLSTYNTFKVASTAQYFAPFESVETLQALIDSFSDTPKLVLGGGSNVLFTKNIEGAVLHNRISGIETVMEDSEHAWIKAGAGESWHQLVMYCVKRNLGGIENLSLIPGSAGAAPMQNIGAYGVEIKDVFHELEALDMHSNSIQTFSNSACAFGYRESIFKNRLKGQYVILNVTLGLHKKPIFNISYGTIAQELEKMGVKTLTIQAVSEAVINIRSSKLPDPVKTGNAGSFFKNPVVSPETFERMQQLHPAIPFFPAENAVKIPAAWLIEQCGFKGYRKGNVGCFETQPLVIVNYGGARGSEIFAFSQDIIAAVEDKFGITLSREVNIY